MAEKKKPATAKENVRRGSLGSMNRNALDMMRQLEGGTVGKKKPTHSKSEQ